MANMSTTIKVTLAALIVASSTVATARAVAQPYPTKPIRLIVPFAPGGLLDIIARMVAPRLTETFKQSIVVDNRPGGGGTIGTETAVKANPDGHTLIMVTAAYATNAALYKLPYEPLQDVAPIALIGESGFLVTVHPSLPVIRTRELISYDNANVGKLNYGSGGPGGANHLATELFNQMAGTKMTHVPYRGTATALNDLLGGQIQLLIATMPTVMPQVKSNRLRAIAVTTAKRSIVVPDIPAVAETVAGYEAVNWAAVLGPRALPNNITVLWNTEINRILRLPEVKERLAGDGMEPAGGSPERFGEVLRRDITKWQKVVKYANIKPEG